MKKRGFTLVELLVVIVILGIIAGLSIPLIRNLTVAFDKRKYESYEESVLYAAKLYNDSYNEDLFGHNKNGCCYITYEDLKEKRLINDIEVEGMSCNSDLTYVRVNKQQDKYSYKPFISCGEEEDGEAKDITLSIPDEVPERDVISCTCTNEPNILITADTSEASAKVKKNTKKTKVTLTSGTGIGSKIVIYTKWSTIWNDYSDDGFTKLDFKVIENQEKVLETKDIVTTSNEILTPPKNGEFYLIIRVDYLEDLYGNKWKNTQSEDPNSKYITIMPPFVIADYKALSEVSLTIANSTYNEETEDYDWTNKDIELGIRAKAFAPITKLYSTMNPEEQEWPEITDVPTGEKEVSFTKMFSGDTQNKQYYVRACDREGNCVDRSTWIKIDKLPPRITAVKNSSGGKWTKDDITIGVAAEDDHSGIGKYYYSYSTTSTEIGSDPANTWVEIPTVDDKSKCYSATGKTINSCGIKTFSINNGEVLDNTIYIKVSDKAGNYSSIPSTVIKQDRSVPKITSVDNPYNDKWINKAFTVVIKATDTGSGINKYYWSNNSNTKPDTSTYWGQLKECGTGKTTCNSSWSKQRNDTIYLKVCDVVGNCSNRSYTKIKIDTTKPTCTVKKTKTGTSGVSTSVSCSDKGGSGKKSCDNGKSGLKPSKTTTYTYYTTDYAGNTGSCTVKVTKKCNKLKCTDWDWLNNNYWKCNTFGKGVSRPYDNLCIMARSTCKKFVDYIGTEITGGLWHWYSYRDCSNYYGGKTAEQCKSLNNTHTGTYCWGVCEKDGVKVLQSLVNGRYNATYKGYGACQVCLETSCSSYTYK